MIWAEARGVGGRGAIGRGGEMPWHLPEDLSHFKRETLGAPVIMGRRTWESLPARFRPLPGRENVVVTRDRGFAAPGAIVAHSLDEALAETRDRGAERVWIMGGGELYRAAMSLADELVVTRIELDVPDADTFAPQIGPEFVLQEQTEPETSSTGLSYAFQRWVRA
ncbi:dihydrofolate reductase [Leucobacter triazinivorans]|uniref:Dihydrofolate reductase n=2 Tax=Leucobacter triazinivorans TaxID=1784719 RepID=A0A4V0Z1Z8_9MICO|nr:dihydrofolate reductase [Leucobacter triazinivorans]QBE50159.1 dihydrofolate reductase [Leucobacter triazinivorans]